MAYAGGLEQIGLIGLKDVGRVSFINNKTGNEDLYIDYANTFTITTTADKVTARGRGSDMVAWDLPKTVEATMDCEVTSLEVQSVLNGTALANANRTFYNREVFTLTQANQAVDLREVPAANTQVRYYKVDKDKRTKIAGATVTSVPVAQLTDSTATPVQKRKLTTAQTVVGDIIVVTYQTTKQALSFTIASINENSASYTMVIHAKAKTHADGVYVPVQVVFKNVNLRANGDLTFDAENPSPFTVTIDIMQDTDGNIAEWALIPDITVGADAKVPYPLN